MSNHIVLIIIYSLYGLSIINKQIIFFYFVFKSMFDLADHLKKNSTTYMIISIVVLGLLAFIFFSAFLGIASKNAAGLDNRPRWMMGGLRDDTGSHNAKDVFGMGFGLDQTRKGVATVDGVYNVGLGLATRSVGGKTQSEYG